MTLPASIRVNAQFPFPSLVKGSGPIIIAKANGIWTVGFTIAQLAPMLVGSDPTTKLVLIYDQVTGAFLQTTIATLIGAAANTYRIVTAAGNVAVLATDLVILMNKAVGAATSIVLPPSVQRNGAPLTVKDLKGDANANNITFVPDGVETIDGFDAATAAANGSALIDINYGKKTLYPLTAGGWYL